MGGDVAPDLRMMGSYPSDAHGTMAEVYETFVTPFQKSNRRRLIYDMWVQLRGAISYLMPIEETMDRRELTTRELEPGDIDVVTILDAPRTTPPRTRQLLSKSLPRQVHSQLLALRLDADLSLSSG